MSAAKASSDPHASDSPAPGQQLFDHIPLLRPWLGEEEVEAVRRVILSGWITQGPVVAELERAVASFVAAAHGVATNAATSALHLALLTSGVEPGDEVICPATTCMATANAILIAGAMPVFADVDADTFNLDVGHAETLVGSRTRALMVVHQIGLPAEIDRCEELARRRGLVVIEDAATALGARFRGESLGARGNPTCYSFHPRKMITTGEGGMLVTANEQQAERARALRATGASISDLVRHQARGVLQQTYDEAGFNYRLTDMQAAVGLVQLGRLPEMLRLRREQAARYDAVLAHLDEVQTPVVPPHVEPCWSSYCIKLRPSARRTVDELVEHMAARGISCRRGIPPLYKEPVFAVRFPELHLPGSEDVERTTMFLPIFPGLREEEQEAVAATLRAGLVAA